MKKSMKVIINIVMTGFFIILMGYHITDNKIHEYLGIITLLLIVIHNALNIKWYKGIFKGKYNFTRILYMIIDLLLLIDTIGIAISSVVISVNAFSFLNIQTTFWARKLHMACTAWGFILISLHIGIHLNTLFMKVKNKLRNSKFEYVYYFLFLLIVMYGGYSFVINKIWEDMFVKSDFKFFNFDKNPIVFYIEYIAMLLFISFIMYYVHTLIKNIVNKRKIEIGGKNNG